jgi:hypothetical protein
LTRSDIEQYYQDAEFPPVRIEPQGWDDFWTSGIHSRVKPRLEFSDGLTEGYLTYKLVLVDYGYPPGFDFRCH